MKIVKIAAQPFHLLNFRTSGKNNTKERKLLPFYKVIVDAMPEGLTAFVATSDLQGRESGPKNRLLGEVVAEELAILQEMGEFPALDMAVLAGDFYDEPEQSKRGGTGDVTSVLNSFADCFPAVLFVYGNHDLVTENALPEHVTILDGTSVLQGELQIGGVSGIIGRIDRNQRKTEPDFLQALRCVLKDKNHLNVLHQGPDDSAQNQRGTPAIRAVLEEVGEGILLFGHCHWKNPLVTIGKMQVLNLDCKVFVFVAE